MVLALQSIIAARGDAIVISYSFQPQLNDPPLQTKSFLELFHLMSDIASQKK